MWLCFCFCSLFFGNAFFPLETVFRSFPFHLFALNAKHTNKHKHDNSFSLNNFSSTNIFSMAISTTRIREHLFVSFVHFVCYFTLRHKAIHKKRLFFWEHFNRFECFGWENEIKRLIKTMNDKNFCFWIYCFVLHDEEEKFFRVRKKMTNERSQFFSF